MNRRNGVLPSLALGGALCGLLACQNHDFEPQEPLVVEVKTVSMSVPVRKANLMFLVDRSGSMGSPIDSSLPECHLNNAVCGSTSNPCPSSCPTRGSEFKTALNTFLSSSGSLARMGVTFYSTSDGAIGSECNAPTASDIVVPINTSTDDGPLLQETADQVNAAVQQVTFLGGTPTAASLRALIGDPALVDAEPYRAKVVLLVTDGLPNCNANHSWTGCVCTGSGNQCLPANLTQAICLDDANSVSAVTELKARDIRTVVVGFGADTTSVEAFATLNSMAEAGGLARDCGTAGASCQKYYQASNGAELTEVLKRIMKVLFPCDFQLGDTVPQLKGMIQLKVNGEVVSPANWEYDASANEVRLTARYCESVRESATDSFPVELKAVEAL